MESDSAENYSHIIDATLGKCGGASGISLVMVHRWQCRLEIPAAATTRIFNVPLTINAINRCVG